MNSCLSSSKTVLEQIAGIVSECSYDPRRDMHFIDPKTVPGWNGEKTGYWIPNCVDSVCGNPECCRTISFVPEPTGWDFEKAKTIITVATCSGCQQQSEFILIDIKKGDQPEGCGAIWQNPAPTELRETLTDKESVPYDIFDAYEEAIGCFNDRRWRAVVTECGRALEGITHNKFSTEEQRKQLGEISNLKAASLDQALSKKEPDLAGIVAFTLFEPLLDLTKAIRLGRLTGAHFNLKRKADLEIAEEVLSLTEYLIEYFYGLPSRATKLKEKVNELETPKTN